MNMKIFNKFRFFSAIFFASTLFFSCRPQISVRAGSGDDATIFFSTGFSEGIARTLKSMAGASADGPLFNKNDVISLLAEAGAANISASLPSPTEITATGTILSLTQNPLAKTGLLKKTEKSLTLAIGEKQITAFYGVLSDEAKSYFDLMMIPALIGEKMSVKEYRELLAAMYGPTFASEIVDGGITIQLASPDGRKTRKESLTLGELLTAEKELSWTLQF